MPGNEFITQNQHVNFAKKVDARLDALEANATKELALTISKSGWTKDSGNTKFPYQYKLTVEGVTDASRADVVLDADSVAVASDCGVCAESNTTANTVIIISRTAPTADLTGVLYVRKSAVLSSGT